MPSAGSILVMVIKCADSFNDLTMHKCALDIVSTLIDKIDRMNETIGLKRSRPSHPSIAPVRVLRA